MESININKAKNIKEIKAREDNNVKSDWINLLSPKATNWKE